MSGWDWDPDFVEDHPKKKCLTVVQDSSVSIELFCLLFLCIEFDSLIAMAMPRCKKQSKCL
jgi:hypothetical protein